MKIVVIVLSIFTVVAYGWECPECGVDNSGAICEECGLIEPPQGMVYIPAGYVVTDGYKVYYHSFFIDTFPVSYRQIIPWINMSIESVENLAIIITGKFDQELQFLKFTPFTGSEDGSGLTVPANCFDLPVGSITWEASRLFLSQVGKRLPTKVEIIAAWEAGIIEPIDVKAVMSVYEDVTVYFMGGSIELGAIDSQAMFRSGYSTLEERVMWEWTGDSWGWLPEDQISEPDSPTRLLFKPLSEPGFGFTQGNYGYFNVTFRGVVPAIVPGEMELAEPESIL